MLFAQKPSTRVSNGLIGWFFMGSPASIVNYGTEYIVVNPGNGVSTQAAGFPIPNFPTTRFPGIRCPTIDARYFAPVRDTVFELTGDMSACAWYKAFSGASGSGTIAGVGDNGTARCWAFFW